jgi:hypothetical protein
MTRLRLLAQLSYDLSSAVWQALETAAKRADVSLRMEMLHNLEFYRDGACKPKQALDFLAAFLDDTTLRDMTRDKALYDDLSAYSSMPKLEVRNAAAMELATVLDSQIKLPNNRYNKNAEPWTPEQWEKFRKQVREALKKRLEAEAAIQEPQAPSEN